jgi:hypothetical protein
MDKLFPFTVGVFLFMSMLTLAFLLGAPRDPLGAICLRANPIRSSMAFLRREHEIRCDTSDGPIITIAIFGE